VETNSNWRSALSVHEHRLLGFGAAFKLEKKSDLSAVAKKMPERVAICNPILIAGFSHLEGVLRQASVSWNHRIELARNTSIDLLMRISGRRQIAEAIALSSLDKADRFAVFGMLDSEERISELFDMIGRLPGVMSRDDRLLLMDQTKRKRLLSIHSLPKWLGEDQLVTILREESVILPFR
jgi:tRNA threonylcarbamoyladenosine modification (KEOPS) complex Cgi121 subunit